MRKISLALLLICCWSFCYSQQYTVTTLKAGEDLDIHSQYRFPEFTTGEVKFKAGGALDGKLNFNMLTCKMDFINPAGDTLAIAKPEQIASIQIGGSIFYYSQDYREIVAKNDTFQLVVLRKVSVEPVKIGALGLRDKNGGVQDYNIVFTQHHAADLTLNEDVDIKRQDIYLLVTTSGEYVATKSTFIKLFSQQKHDIESFIKKEKINFFKEDSLRKLFDYCSKP
jgi:hypothetical protein